MKVGIVGGGIMGQLVALSLLNAGWQVAVFDAGATRNCSMTAAGMLSPVAELEKNDMTIYHLGLEALRQYWPAIVQQLSFQGYFKVAGSLLLAHPRDRQELRHFVARLQKKLPDEGGIRPLQQSLLQTLEPALHAFNEAYYCRDEGQIDCQALLLALENYLREQGVHWYQPAVVSRVSAGQIEWQSQIYHYDWVLDCRGLSAKAHFTDLRAVRGELLWLHAPHVDITRPLRILHPRYGLYIVPRLDHHYVVGASEIEADDESAISVRTMLELLTAVFCVHADFAEARVVHTMTHCRPTLKDHLPRIKYAPGLIAVNGLYRHGFLIAPTLAKEVTHYLCAGMNYLNYPHLWEQMT